MSMPKLPFLALFFFASVAHAVMPAECVKYLSDLAYTRWAGGSYTLDEAERAFHKKYRNDPAFAAWVIRQDALTETPEAMLARYQTQRTTAEELAPATWNLTDYGRNLPPITEDTRPMHGVKYHAARLLRFFRLIRTLPKRSPYDEAVLSLRKGDTVQFGAERFVLGDFLGSGNTTFVFRLRDQPGRAIRIPFLIAPFKAIGFHPEFFNRVTRWTVVNPEIPQVNVYRSQKGFSIVSAVDGTENGNEFLISVRRRFLDKISPDMQVFFLEMPEQNPWWATSHWYADVEKWAREQGDLELVGRLQLLRKRANQMQNNALGVGILLYARQLVWDETQKDWILVDRE
jgi:hypothetical protein